MYIRYRKTMHLILGNNLYFCNYRWFLYSYKLMKAMLISFAFWPCKPHHTIPWLKQFTIKHQWNQPDEIFAMKLNCDCVFSKYLYLYCLLMSWCFITFTMRGSVKRIDVDCTFLLFYILKIIWYLSHHWFVYLVVCDCDHASHQQQPTTQSEFSSRYQMPTMTNTSDLHVSSSLCLA